jgi:hypothetical protein
VGFLKLSPCFAAGNYVSMMNPRWQHILRRPNLQDLRRLKFTRQVVQTKSHNPVNLHVYTNHHKGQVFQQYQPVISTFGEFSSCSEVSSASLPSLLLSSSSLPEPSPYVSVVSSSSSLEEDSGDAMPFPRFSS